MTGNSREGHGLPKVTAWSELAPEYEALAKGPPAGAEEEWLSRWSRFSEGVAEAASWLSIRRSQDTADMDRKTEFLAYVKEVAPRIQEAEHGLKSALVSTGWSRPDMAPVLRRFRAAMDLFRDENLPLLAEERALSTRYSEIVGGLQVDFRGEKRTLAQLAPFRSMPDRSIREAAWRAGSEAMLGVRADLDALFDELFALRRRIAANAGYGDYTDYRWQQLGRFDYTPAHAEEFHDAIRLAAVPALERASSARAAALGVEVLRPWDVEVDPYGAEPLRPFDDGADLAAKAAAVFTRLDSSLGQMVQTMADEDLLDLDNRPGKAPGGYCATLATRRRPFIFMNAVGTEDNARTMLHEAGHAFHVFLNAHQPYIWQRGAPMEFAEVASMSMELLTSPYLEAAAGGFYTRREAIRSRTHHLDRMIRFLPYMATVSRFQHRLYALGDQDHAQRDALWSGLYREYNVGVDWTGLEETLSSLWHHKLHIFTVPFYYIEYGLAQMGALQVWRNSLKDPDGALRAYRSALALGGTRRLPDLFAAAGARLLFDKGGVGELVTLAEEKLADLRAQTAA